MTKTYNFLFLLIFQIQFIYGSTSLEFRSVRCKHNKKHFSNFTMYISNGSINTDMFVKQSLEPGYKANFEFKIRLSNSKSYQSLFSYTIDVCSMVFLLKETMFKKWFRSVLKYGNFMDNCPVVPGHYYLNNWKLEADLLPPYLYPGDYRIIARGFYGEQKSKTEDFIVECDVETLIK